MNFNIAITLLLFFGAFTASAQDEIFKVLVSKGANKITSNNASTNVTIGKKLYKNDKITVGPSGYIGLAHSCGKTIEIKTPGTYEIHKLSAEVAAQNKGVCKKYVDFVVGEMTTQEEDLAKNKYKYMAVTGSVERGEVIEEYYHPYELALNAPVTLKWKMKKPDDQYRVEIFNLFDEEVYKEVISNNYFHIDLSKYNYQKEKTFKWKISLVRDPKIYAEGALNSLPDSKDTEIAAELAEVKKELGDESTALNKFVLANIYAEKGLHVDAVSYYEAAIEMAPEVEEFQIAYKTYLIKKGILKEKKEEKK